MDGFESCAIRDAARRERATAGERRRVEAWDGRSRTIGRKRWGGMRLAFLPSLGPPRRGTSATPIARRTARTAVAE